jgi:hypothetical protein
MAMNSADVDRRFDRRARVKAALNRARNKKGLVSKIRKLQGRAAPAKGVGRLRAKMKPKMSY